MSHREPSLSFRENFLRAVEFRYPERIPCFIDFLPAVWNIYHEKLMEIILRHPLIFRNFKPENVKYEERHGLLKSKRISKDSFGCVWAFLMDGLEGQVIKYPLESWEHFNDFKLPDPEDGLPTMSGGLIPWDKVYDGLEKAKSRGDLVVGHMPHSFFFQRPYYLRGFENLMKDFVKKPSQLYSLIEQLTEYNLELVRRLLKFKGLDMISFGDDLGMQDRLPISPKTFREFITPSYRKIFRYVRGEGVHVYLHSDGHILEIMEDLIESGVSVINVEEQVNGMGNLAKYRGRVCLDVYADPQHLLPFGTPSEVKAYVRCMVQFLSLKSGGLMIRAEPNLPIKLENVEALCQVMEEVMWLQ